MKTWKLVAGIVSMLASAMVLTSAITSYRDLAGTAVQPSGLYSLFLAAALLGLAGIVQVVFRDGEDRRATLAVVGIYAAAFLFFVITAIVARFDAAGWIQILTFTIWSVGCAVFAYLDMVWAQAGGAGGVPATQAKEGNDGAAAGGPASSEPDEASGDSEPEEAEGLAELDLPPVPDADETAKKNSTIPPRAGALGEAVWDGTSAPPRL